jgi:class 3 adenylate cyclase
MTPTTPKSGATPRLPQDCQTETLGVTFFDLSRFAAWGSSDDDEAVAAFLQQFYQLSADHIEPAGGRIVKFIGDAGLAVFPRDGAEDVVFALCELSKVTRQRGADVGLDTYLNINVHVGPVLTGSFGPAGGERYDVIGKTVNIAARLGRRGVVLSPQAFRCLSEEARERFQKVTRPVTYLLRG